MNKKELTLKDAFIVPEEILSLHEYYKFNYVRDYCKVIHRMINSKIIYNKVTKFDYALAQLNPVTKFKLKLYMLANRLNKLEITEENKKAILFNFQYFLNFHYEFMGIKDRNSAMYKYCMQNKVLNYFEIIEVLSNPELDFKNSKLHAEFWEDLERLKHEHEK